MHLDVPFAFPAFRLSRDEPFDVCLVIEEMQAFMNANPQTTTTVLMKQSVDAAAKVGDRSLRSHAIATSFRQSNSICFSVMLLLVVNLSGFDCFCFHRMHFEILNICAPPPPPRHLPTLPMKRRERSVRWRPMG